MKKLWKVLIVNIVFLLLIATTLYAGEDDKNAVTIGILQGGGSLVGFDYERLLFGPMGFQIGAGYLGLGAAVNIHLRPEIRSSFVSMGLWNQGLFGEQLSARIVGATFVYRGRKWFTAQIGAGYVLKRSASSTEYLRSTLGIEPSSVMLLYSIGGYFSF